jgi:hypothetical protein
MKHIKLLFLVLIAGSIGCKDRFDFELKDTDVSLLVVEGFLNAGQDSTIITLSRTVKVNSITAFKPELNASVTVEAKTGGSLALTQINTGKYFYNRLPLVQGGEYRLRICTSDNREYLSDYVPVKPCPPIDSISWKRTNEGLELFANTHDNTNNSRYYTWHYDETWEIRSFYLAEYEWISGSTIVPTLNPKYQCWKYAKSTNIILGTSAHLQADVIKEAPIHFIPALAERIGVRYSILLKQQTLTKEAYEYLKLMKQNTESIGSIFDPQPSELKGNIKCLTNPSEGVIGYLTAGETTQKRIFIQPHEVNWFFPQSCPDIPVKNHPDSIQEWVPAHLPYKAHMPTGVIEYYFMAEARCVDCTKRGGNLNRPSYW